MKLIFLFSLLFSFGALAQKAPLTALVYGGIGACEEDCVTGAAEAARLAGFQPVIVYPDTFDPGMLSDAAVWIQPGGKSKGAAKAMGKTMLGHIRNFVKNGGGYVGFCAGAFLATSKIGTSFTDGLGILPGKTILYKAQGYPTIEKMSWLTSKGVEARNIYWEGGPYFSFSDAQRKTLSVVGTYSRTNQISAVQSAYGKGRVSVTGAHPEAPEWWRSSSNLIDPDGLDYDLTSEMIIWAANRP